MTDSSFYRAIMLGVVVGIAVMFLVATGMVFVGGQSLAVSAGVAVWVGIVIGPYAGGLAMVSRAESKRPAEVHELLVPQEQEQERSAA